MDDGGQPARGRARGRAAARLAQHAVADEQSPLDQDAPPQSEIEEQRSNSSTYTRSFARERGYDDNGNGNGNGGNGNGGNGNGGNGNGSNGSGSGSPGSDRGGGNGRRGRRSSDEEMPQEGRIQRIHALPGFGRGFQTVHTRPDGWDKTGTSGVTQKFLANYFPLQIKKAVVFRLHAVTFDPELDHILKRKALMRTKDTEIGPFLFDGAQLFTSHELSFEQCNFQVQFPDGDEHWNVNIEFTRVCDVSEPVTTQLFNVLLKKAQEKLELALLGRFYFDSNATINITNHRLQLWPGFVTSIRQMEREVLLNVDLTFKVCRTEDVFTLMKQIRQSHPDNYQAQCEQVIVGSVVMTTYNRTTYKITGIDWNLRPTDTFNKGGAPISFMDYFKNKKVTIASIGQPMLVSSPTERERRRGETGDKLLPPEMCYQTGLNDDMRANFRLMKDLATHLHMEPNQRLGQTTNFIRRMVANEGISGELLRWGMKLNPSPVEIAGRVLIPDEIRFRDGPYKSNEKADWTMAFRSNAMLVAKQVKQWVIMFPTKEAGGITELVRTMQRVAQPLGFILPQPTQLRMTDLSQRGYADMIDTAMDQHKGELDIIVMVLPNTRLDVYASCKKSCSLKYGVPSQCFLTKNLNNAKGLMSICTKLVIQMNAKLGGQPWGLMNPLKDLMVVGFDVHHGGGRSHGAMAATTSQNVASYYSTILVQEPGIEMASVMAAAFERCLYAFRQANGTFPTRIMFYRDGVGEGQLKYVAENEVRALRESMKTVYGENVGLPKFSLIVVTKRINTRIFRTDGNKVINPMPGTVVDERITCPERYDFFLVPQTARQGTVSPVGYNVICDESGLDADKMQRFAFKLCHGYFNWSGTVAVPAPCQYAHKLAFLTGTALLSEANERLLNNLHYL